MVLVLQYGKFYIMYFFVISVLLKRFIRFILELFCFNNGSELEYCFVVIFLAIKVY